MTRSIERRLAYVEAQQDEERRAEEAMAARYAHLSRAELERLVLDEMTDYLAARSFPAPAGTISAEAVEAARKSFHGVAFMAVIDAAISRQENAHAPH